jgi:hypothetical protein
MSVGRLIVSDTEDDLRATAEDIAADSARLTRIEIEKTNLDADDPRLPDLSAEGERIARRIVPKTAAESDLVARLQEANAD